MQQRTPDPVPTVPCGSLIVSCQAEPGTPLAHPDSIATMACAALEGGAGGIRADGAENIAAIRCRCDTLIVGSYKIRSKATAVYVTPSLDAAMQVIDAGADIIGMEATDRPLADGSSTYETIHRIKQDRNTPIMADVSMVAEAEKAVDAGADYVTTALAGFTDYSRRADKPDWNLLSQMVAMLDAPVVGEGRYWTNEEAARALDIGAHAVVIGTAITDPLKITRRFVKTMQAVKRI